MKLRYAAKAAVKSRRMRALIQRRGYVGKSQPLWTVAERDTVRQLYPDYGALRRALPRRTYSALRSAARLQGVAVRRHIWTITEVSRMRRVYTTAKRPQVEAAFPDITWGKIKAKARHLNLRRPRVPYVPTGFAILDAIRARAFDLNISMVELDAMARTKRDFQKALWSGRRRPNARAVLLAVYALGGELSVKWSER